MKNKRSRKKAIGIALVTIMIASIFAVIPVVGADSDITSTTPPEGYEPEAVEPFTGGSDATNATNVILPSYEGNSSSQRITGVVIPITNGDFSDPTGAYWDCYENDLTGGCTGTCTIGDSLAECSPTYSGMYISSPYSGWVHSGDTGYCGDGGLVREIPFPDVTPLYLHFWARSGGDYWGGYSGVTIDTSHYGPSPADTSPEKIGHWLAGQKWGGHRPMGTITDSDTGENYTPAHITPEWNEFWIDVSRWSGQTVTLRVMVFDYSGHWCNMGDHTRWIAVDDFYFVVPTIPEDVLKYAPNLWFDSEEQLYPTSPFFDDEDLSGEDNKNDYYALSFNQKVDNFTIYYHTVDTGEEIVYEYWFYYAYNDWVNKHYHDWETVYVFVDKATGNVTSVSTI